MYTFWKRTSAAAIARHLRRPRPRDLHRPPARTNTPLQALVLMNDPTYVEASRKLAERMMTEVSGSGKGDAATGND